MNQNEAEPNAVNGETESSFFITASYFFNCVSNFVKEKAEGKDTSAAGKKLALGELTFRVALSNLTQEQLVELNLASFLMLAESLPTDMALRYLTSLEQITSPEE